jgi:enoyl-CoA hydratase
MSDVVDYAETDGIATLTLDNGKANVISHEVIGGFNAALDRSEAEGTTVVITGKPGILSGGYDLRVVSLGPQELIALVTAGSSLARRMLAHPTPIVVACTGHAVGMGAFLMLSADYRVGADGPFQIGLPESQVGMTMNHVGLALARDRLAKPYLNRAVMNAEMFDPAGAVASGFLDMVVAPEALTDAARMAAGRLRGLHPVAHAKNKVMARKELLDALDWAIEEDQRHPPEMLGT